MKPANPRYILSAVFGFILWGLFPIYFKQLITISPWEVVGHRILWSFVFLLGYVLVTRSHSKLFNIVSDTRSFLLLGLAAALISSNWLTYVIAVTEGHILETSLAYFISPLFTIMLGLFFLNEKKSKYKTVALFLCIVAIALKITLEQTLSHYTIILAVTFSIYSMVKKKIPHPSLYSFLIEVSYLMLPTLIYFSYLFHNDRLAFSTANPLTPLLIGLGLVTSIPLIIFARSVKYVDLSIMGFLQYISPFILFLTATLIYREKFGVSDMVSFPLIWVAVGIISYESIKKKWENKKNHLPTL